MANFLVVEPDPFQDTIGKVRHGQVLSGVGDLINSRPTDFSHVRRPYRGIQLKEETFATIEVVRADGTPIPLLNSSAPPSRDGLGRGDRYSNFVLQSITEQRMERRQIIETFGEAWIFFAGQSPMFLQVSALLLNSADFKWRNEFWRNYEETLRGTKCAQNNARVYLSWDDVLVEGYMTTAQASESPNPQFLVQLGFELFVTRYEIMDTVGVTKFPGTAWDYPNEKTTVTQTDYDLTFGGVLNVANGAASINTGGLINALKDPSSLIKNAFSGSLNYSEKNQALLPKNLRRTDMVYNVDEYPQPAQNFVNTVSAAEGLAIKTLSKPELDLSLNGFMNSEGFGASAGAILKRGSTTTAGTFSIAKLGQTSNASTGIGFVSPKDKFSDGVSTAV